LGWNLVFRMEAVKTLIFEPGVIKVEKEREFGDLKAAIEKAFAADRVTKYLKGLDSRKIRIRNLDAAFAAVIDRVSGEKAGRRELCMNRCRFRIRPRCGSFISRRSKEVDPALRAKFHKLYQYY